MKRTLTYSVLVVALMLSMVAIAPAASAEDPDPNAPEPASTCLIQLTEDVDGLVAGLSGLEVRLTQTSTDPAIAVFEGSLLTLPLTVTLWRGASNGQVESAVNGMSTSWEALANQSVENATDSDETDAEEEETFSDLSAGPALETIAYRAKLGPLLEFGTQALASTGQAIHRFDCATNVLTTLTTVILDSVLGKITLPRSSTPLAEPDSASAAPALYAFPNRSAGTTTAFLPSETPYATTAAASIPNSVIRYRTFISAAKVGSPCGTFRGDNRSFSNYYDKPNRTRVSVFYKWSTKKISTTTHIGTTHKLNSSGSVIQSKTASSKGIKFQAPLMYGTSYGRIEVNHAVGNPLCSVAGPIAYSVVMEAWRDGAARIAGKRRKVPNHEAYLYPKSESYGNTIFKRSTTNFMCLNLNCGDESLWETTP